MPVALVLPPSCRLGSAGEVQALLTERLVDAGDLAIDAAAVTEADLTLVQLLLAARRRVGQGGGRLVAAVEPSPAVRDVLAAAGVPGLLAEVVTSEVPS